MPLTEPTMRISDARMAEGDSGTSIARLTVSLTPAAQQPITVDYASSDGTAKAGEDHDAVSGRLSFASGETVKTIDVRVRGDLAAENNETFYVTLSRAVGARIVSSEGVGIIEDDDGAADLRTVPTFTFSSPQLLDSVAVSNAGPRAQLPGRRVLRSGLATGAFGRFEATSGSSLMRKAASLAVVLFCLPLLAQAPHLVKDINTTYATATKSSSPAQFVAYNGKVFFVATTDDAGAELWSTDGTPAGATRVSDIVPGSGSSDPTSFIVFNGKLFFVAHDVDHGVELWTTDGTAAGTRLFMDLNPGPSSSQPIAKIVYKNRMLFGADDGTNGRELWITDGTTAGTRMLKDIVVGSASSSPVSFTIFHDVVYFLSAGGLWKTDGTDGGTVKVASVTGRNLFVAGSQLFFEGFTGAAGWEPWVSDGSESGTHMIADVFPGSSGSRPNFNDVDFIAFGSRVLFVANDGVNGREIWISDGTAAGTRMVRDLAPGPNGAFAQGGFAILTALGDRAFFILRDDAHGQELWVTDGTDAGTSLFADLAPGTASTNPSGLVVSGGKLYFGGSNLSTLARPLWVSDGTPDGTHIVKAADGSEFSYGLAWPVEGKVYFAGSTSLAGQEPWVTDGTDAGTFMIANLGADRAASSAPNSLTAAGNLLFFYATEGTISPVTHVAESSLWRSDGTEGGTFKLRESGQNPSALQGIGPFVFFGATVNSKGVLMMSDGTVEGTRPADTFVQRFGPSPVSTFFPFGNILYASVLDLGIYDSSLWKTTVAINAPAESLGTRNPFGMIESSGRQVFYAEGPSGVYNYGLWMTDGTRVGTHAIVPDLGDTISQKPSAVVSAAGTLFFVKQLRDDVPKLWKSDGTFEGTTAVKIVPGVPLADIKAAGRRIFFVPGLGLWTSDGTDAGTFELMKVDFSRTTVKDNLKVVGDRVFFVLRDAASVDHLWTSDGSTAGTKDLQKVGPSPELASIDGLVYFSGTDDLHGAELWATDGTSDGTKLIADVNPGPGSSNPGGFTRVGNILYFRATTDATGGELWALPLTDAAIAISDARVVEGDSGTSAARFSVSLTQASQQPVSVEYATSDGTAKAGEDYDAGSGTLSFAPGETAKAIDVRVRGDLLLEGNEMFYVTLRNAVGARLIANDAVGIIENDDGAADLRVVPLFAASGFEFADAVTVFNDGPRAATDVSVRFTVTPDFSPTRCRICEIPQIAAGSSTVVGADHARNGGQSYLSATATARQSDPLISNNSASWMMNKDRTMVMDAVYLNVSGTATITALTDTTAPSVLSSDVSVVSVSNVLKSAANVATFTVRGLKAGTSTITVDRLPNPLVVTVVNPGTTPLWPGALRGGVDFTALGFEKPLTLTLEETMTAPLTGASPTGTVIIMSAGKELARRTLTGAGTYVIPFYLPALGTNAFQIAYSGDSSFQSQTSNGSVFVTKGRATLLGDLRPVPGATGTFSLTVHAVGSPASPPSGTIIVKNGAAEIARLTLMPEGGPSSVAQATLTNLPVGPTLTLSYGGDAFYDGGSQQVRATDSKRRAVHH
ncbi:MAG TPA: ELWxxDGT repeat protein [Thermoanaerobaculia bacterium]|nr:ELWxxDGT repeat protein [Thermoanaerobaculia bacterium]